MILAVNPNPALDVTYTLDAIDLGRSHRVPTPISQAGGKAVNVARVLHARGEDVRVIAPVGGDAGSVFTADLASSGIPYLAVPIAGATRSTVAIVTPEHTTNLNEAGPELSAAEWASVEDALVSELARNDVSVVVISGSLPTGTPRDLVARLTRCAVAAGVPAIVDVSGPALLDAIAAGAAVVKPNRDELAATLGSDRPLSGARELAAQGPLVIASLGEDGLLAVDPSGTALHAALDAVLQGNPTGAGDAAVAAIAQSFAHGDWTLEGLARDAVAWSAAAVLAPRAGEIADPEPLAARVSVRAVTEEEWT